MQDDAFVAKLREGDRTTVDAKRVLAALRFQHDTRTSLSFSNTDGDACREMTTVKMRLAYPSPHPGSSSQFRIRNEALTLRSRHIVVCIC